MKTSTERILTTHTGSLPRPAGLTDRHDHDAVRAAVQETVRRQLEAGVDIVNDGEVSKPSYATYVTERLSGFTGEPVPLALRGFEEFPEFAQKMWGDPDMAAIMANPSCDGPVAYVDRSLVEADIANLRRRRGRRGRGLHVGGIARRHRDVHGQPLLPQHRGVPVRPGRCDEAGVRRHLPGRPGPAAGLPGPGV